MIIHVPKDYFILENTTVHTLMTYKSHFIWVFTVCQSTCVSVSRIKSVKTAFVISNNTWSEKTAYNNLSCLNVAFNTGKFEIR